MNWWKNAIESFLLANYPGTTIKWDGSDITIVIPDNLIGKSDEIIASTKDALKMLGAEVDFYPEKAKYTVTP